MLDTVTPEFSANDPMSAQRAEVQALYLQGLPARIVADKTGVKYATIRTWINRYNWDILRLKIGHKIQKTVTEPILAQPVAKASERVRKGISDDLEKAMEILSKVKHSKRLPEMIKRADVVSKIVGSANKVFGWDQQSSSTIASVQSLSSELPVLDQIEHNAKPSVQLTEGETKPDGA